MNIRYRPTVTLNEAIRPHGKIKINRYRSKILYHGNIVGTFQQLWAVILI